MGTDRDIEREFAQNKLENGRTFRVIFWRKMLKIALWFEGVCEMGAGRVLFAVLATLLVVGVVAGIGFTAYNAGVSQGLVDSGKLVIQAAPVTGDGTTTVPVAPYGMYRGFGYGGYGWGGPFRGGFGFLGCLVPLFFILLIFGLFRFAFRPRWGRGWGGPGMGMRGWGGPGNGDIPDGVKEWHRKLHEEENAAQTPPAPSASS